MKIVDVKAMTIQMNSWRYPIVRIETDEGVSGLGEGRDGSDKRLLLELKRFLVGEDPTNVERLFQKIRPRGGRGATGRQGGGVSGVEMALWDIAGKAAGVPVYQLIGGKRRDKVRVYVDSGVGVTTGWFPSSTVSRCGVGASLYGRSLCGEGAAEEGHGVLHCQVRFRLPRQVLECAGLCPWTAHQ